MINFKDFLLEEILADDLKELYNINYKYDMIKLSKFNGLPKRRENIIKKIEFDGVIVANSVIKELITVFEGWLSRHDLDSPVNWAKIRVQGLDYINDNVREIIDAIESEYNDYSKIFNNNSSSQLIYDYFQYIVNNNIIDKVSVYDWLGYLADDLVEMYTEYIDDDSFSTEERESYQKMIDSLEDGEYEYVFEYIDNVIGLDEVKHYIIGALENADIDNEDFYVELYEYMVFPLWSEYWKSQGISETRDTIYKIKNDLDIALKSKDLSNKFKVINIALNASHQTGSMLDYFEDESPEIDKKLLDDLSNMDVTKLNNELRVQGFKVPKIDHQTLGEDFNGIADNFKGINDSEFEGMLDGKTPQEVERKQRDREQVKNEIDRKNKEKERISNEVQKNKDDIQRMKNNNNTNDSVLNSLYDRIQTSLQKNQDINQNILDLYKKLKNI